MNFYLPGNRKVNQAARRISICRRKPHSAILCSLNGTTFPHAGAGRVNPQVSLPQFYAQLKSSESGLASSEAASRLASLGPNDPQAARRQSIPRDLLGYFANPLVLILLLAALVSGVLGDVLNASIIVAVVLLSVGLNFLQSY